MTKTFGIWAFGFRYCLGFSAFGIWAFGFRYCLGFSASARDEPLDEQFGLELTAERLGA
jgi:hypothetical protein